MLTRPGAFRISQAWRYNVMNVVASLRSYHSMLAYQAAAPLAPTRPAPERVVVCAQQRTEFRWGLVVQLSMIATRRNKLTNGLGGYSNPRGAIGTVLPQHVPGPAPPGRGFSATS